MLQELVVFLSFWYFTETKASPDEDRLLKYLFDPESQKHNLRTTPVLDITELINVRVRIEITKLIAVVSVDNLFYVKLCMNAEQPITFWYTEVAQWLYKQI